MKEKSKMKINYQEKNNLIKLLFIDRLNFF